VYPYVCVCTFGHVFFSNECHAHGRTLRLFTWPGGQAALSVNNAEHVVQLSPCCCLLLCKYTLCQCRSLCITVMVMSRCAQLPVPRSGYQADSLIIMLLSWPQAMGLNAQGLVTLDSCAFTQHGMHTVGCVFCERPQIYVAQHARACVSQVLLGPLLALAII
jgi:hypothetical protein